MRTRVLQLCCVAPLLRWRRGASLADTCLTRHTKTGRHHQLTECLRQHSARLEIELKAAVIVYINICLFYNKVWIVITILEVYTLLQADLCIIGMGRGKSCLPGAACAPPPRVLQSLCLEKILSNFLQAWHRSLSLYITFSMPFVVVFRVFWPKYFRRNSGKPLFVFTISVVYLTSLSTMINRF